MSRARDQLGAYLGAMGFAAEVPFKGVAGTRRWRWDWARGRVAVEYHGIGVGHQGIKGSWRDHRKVTEGQLCGWLVVQCNVESVDSGECLGWVEAAIGQTGQQPGPTGPGRVRRRRVRDAGGPD